MFSTNGTIVSEFVESGNDLLYFVSATPLLCSRLSDNEISRITFVGPLGVYFGDPKIVLEQCGCSYYQKYPKVVWAKLRSFCAEDF